MKAIEIKTTTDKNGRLKLDFPLEIPERIVRVLILIAEESEKEEESIWLESISKNPAFDFLKNSEEDIYTVNDGEPYYD